MRKALGCALSAAVLVGSFGAPIPAWSNDPSGSVAAPNANEPVPALVLDGNIIRQEALSPTVEFPSAGLGSPRVIVSEAAYTNSAERNENTAPYDNLEEQGLYARRMQSQADPSEHGSPVASEAPLVEAVPHPVVSDTQNQTKEEKASDAEPVPNSNQPEEQNGDKDVKVNTPDVPNQSAPKDDSKNKPEDKDAALPDIDAEKGKAAESGKKSSIPGVLVFGGTVEAIEQGVLKVSGVDSKGAAVTLDFIVDTGSQIAEGVKNGDKLVVYYEISSTGGYRVTSARYVSGDLPKNVFPEDLPSEIVSKAQKESLVNAQAADKEANAEEEVDIPHIVSIDVEGNKTVSTEEVLQVISTRIGDPLLDARIRRDMQAIYDSGYYTDVRLDTRYAPGGVRLVFRVLENPAINEISITGNNVAATEKLTELMKTKPGQILNTRVLQSDLQAINKYYNEELGYTISPSHVTKLDLTDGKLSIEIVDGITVKEVDVTGVTVFPLEKVTALVKTKPGDLFNRNTLKEDSERISALYDKEDYILDNIKPTVDADTGVVKLQVIEAVLQEVKLVGNKRTKDETILRNLRSKPGEVLRRSKVQKDLERLNNLGFFKKVEPEVEPGSEPGNAILVLNIEEQKTGLATVGVGYAGGGSGAVRPGITGAVSFTERNLFGEGKSISVNLQRGAQIGSYGISYYDPAINKAQDSIGVSVYYNSVDDLQQSVTGAEYGTYAYYDQKVYGGTFTFGHPFTDDLRGFVTLRHETIDVTMASKSIYVPVGLGKGDLNAVSLAALYDTRDDVFTPHKGSYLNASFGYAGNFLGGDYDYTKLVVEGRHYWPVTEKSTLALRGMYGSVGNGSPASEYFYAGGTDTLRGYEDNAFFGTKCVLFNAEYRFPIGGIKMLSGAVFVDAGNAWVSGYSSNQLYTDAGVGLRIVFPNLGLGVIRIDYAFGQDGSRTSIGIGQSF